MRRYFVLIAAMTAALSTVGCGSDSDSGSSDNGGGGSLAQCAGNNSEFTPAEFYAQTAPGKSCSSTSDMASVCANDMPKIVGTCGKGCLNMSNQDQCVAECIQSTLADAKSAPLTDDCLACYGADVVCARDNCLAQCGLNPTGDSCATCRTEKGCAEAFYSCSGFPEPSP